MSKENVQLVRRFYEEHWLDRDIDRIIELAAPDIEYVNPAYAVEPGVRHGPAAVGRAMRGFAEVWQESWHDLHELFDCGDVVVASVTWHTRSSGSEEQLTQEEAHSWTLDAGRVRRFEWGRDVAAALQAASRSGRSG